MKITVLSIGNSALVPQFEVNGVRVEFESQVIRGLAILVPSRNHTPEVRDILYVEEDYDFCSDLQVTPASLTPSLQYLHDCECYLVHAPIERVDDDGLFYTRVEDFVLMVDDFKEQELAVGDWVQFRLHRLSLWDCGL